METHLVYHGRVSQQGARNVEVLIVEAMKKGAVKIVLRLCSAGGDVNAGIGLYNFIKSVPISVDTHSFGFCGSIAATIFLAGARRTTEPLSVFHLHAATYIEGPLKDQISENTFLISQPFRTEAGWDNEAIKEYFSDPMERSLTPQLAVERHIAHEVLALPLPSDPQQIWNVTIPPA